MVVFGQKCLYSGKSGCIRAKWLYLSKSSCIWSKVVVLRQKLLYSGKVVVLEQKWLYSGNLLDSGIHFLSSGKSGCSLAKRFYLGKVVVFLQTVVFGQK